MTVSSSDLNTGSVGDKIVRTSDGAYICTASAGTTILPATDRAWNLPIGAKISVASVSPVKFTAEIREPVLSLPPAATKPGQLLGRRAFETKRPPVDAGGLF